MIFLYESFLLASVFYGDQSKFVKFMKFNADFSIKNFIGFKAWRRLNHASSALFADGLHETVKERQLLPFFIINLRQQIFARIYGSDISFAVFLGRPPRVSKRFCFTNMPLDVREDTYYLVGDALDQELHNLDRAGWNTLGQINRSAIIRWSMITSMIREDTLETLLGRGLSDIPQRIMYAESYHYSLFGLIWRDYKVTLDPKSAKHGRIFLLSLQLQHRTYGKGDGLTTKSISSIRLDCSTSTRHS